MSTKTPQVFVSYAHPATAWVRQFVKQLESRAFHVWLDEREISVGDSLRDAIEKGLRESDAIVAILSRDTLRSPNVAFELGVALGMGKPLIPIVAKDLKQHDLPLNVREKRFLVQDDPAAVANEVSLLLVGRKGSGKTALVKGLTTRSTRARRRQASARR